MKIIIFSPLWTLVPFGVVRCRREVRVSKEAYAELGDGPRDHPVDLWRHR
jgi:hypothetical protein